MTGITLILPLPPSANRICRTKIANGRALIYRSAEYLKWRKEAGLEICLAKNRAIQYNSKIETIEGPFEAVITIDRSQCRKIADIDNRTKPVLDLLQEHGIIANDKLCQRVTTEWGDVARGCRVTVREVKP